MKLSQVLTVVPALQSVLAVTGLLSRRIPAGKFVRLRSVITGTASATVPYTQETKL